MPISSPERAVLVAPFANERIREWPTQQFRRFTELVIEDGSGPVLVIGTKSQRARANELVRGFPALKVVNLCGRLDWSDLVNKIDEAEFVVANNSGVAHLSASRGQWTLCVFSATHSWVEWMPRGERVITISKIPACGPCEIGGDMCPNGIVCMETLEPDFVYRQFRTFQASFGT
jgi:ADP-heptose:LPS heptosyltransferase